VLSLVSFGTEERKVGGKSSQTRGPETAKLRDPYVIVLVLGTIRSRRDLMVPRTRTITYGSVETANKSYTPIPSLMDSKTMTVSAAHYTRQFLSSNISVHTGLLELTILVSSSWVIN